MSGENAVAARGVSVRPSKRKARVIPVLVAGLLAVSGCAMMYSGQRVDRSKLDKVVVGVTSRAEVLAAFGKPHSTAKKQAERITIYVYKYVRNVTVGIPFFVTVGKTATKGHQVTIAVSDETDKVLNYEVTDMDETLV